MATFFSNLKETKWINEKGQDKTRQINLCKQAHYWSIVKKKKKMIKPKEKKENKHHKPNRKANFVR